MKLGSFADPLISLLFPLQCHVCGASVEQHHLGVACITCWESTHLFSEKDALCLKCGVLLHSPSATRCGLCDLHDFDSVLSVGAYHQALSKSVINQKRVDHIPYHLRDLIEERIAPLSSTPVDVVMPIPLSAKRRLERSFNQAESIGILVSKLISKPIDIYSLIRTRHTQMHRVAMDRKARELSVKGSFSVVRPNLISGRSILLVDDIITSGSTASHCARVLKKAGAVEVNVFTIARAANDQ
jgi:ComF family protein